MTIWISVDEGMVSWDRDIVNDSHIAILASSNLDLVFIWTTDQVLGVDDVENLLIIIV